MLTFKQFLSETKKSTKYVKSFLGFITKGEPSHVKEDSAKEIEDLYQAGHRENALHKQLSKHYKFDTESSIPVERYTEGYLKKHGPHHPNHYNLNKALYHGHDLAKVSSKLHDFDHSLSKTLHKHTTPHDLTVHTGIKKSPEHHIDPNSDHIKMRMSAYTSTSLSPDVARRFTRHDPESHFNYVHPNNTIGIANFNPKHHGKLTPEQKEHDTTTFHVPGNEKEHIRKYAHTISIHVPKGSHGAYIANHSDRYNEKEILLHKNAKIHVDKTPTVDHKNWAVNWNARLVHDGVKNV